MSRIDARPKADGSARYVADVSLPGMLHAALSRSSLPHARIRRIDNDAAKSARGVVAVFTADDVSTGTFGRSVRDTPLLARDKVRYVGEPIAAVVATSREAAERGAALIEVDYERLSELNSTEAALAPNAAALHDEPWSYPKAHVKPGAPANLVAFHSAGDLGASEEAFREAPFFVDEIYRTQAVHQGYLEPQACIAAPEENGRIRLWCTHKGPYLLQRLLGACLDIEPERFEIQPIELGADFGGKGSLGHIPLCVELARLTGRPVKLVLRYHEELTTTNPRHPAEIRMRIACDDEGRLLSVVSQAIVDQGAYGGYAPNLHGTITGLVTAPGYRIPNFYAETRLVYTNNVPKGQMRAPGSPQLIFAFESALDELAAKARISPIDLRHRNLLRNGEQRANGHQWLEYRGVETLETAVEQTTLAQAPAGWLIGRGLALHDRPVHEVSGTTLRLSALKDGGITVETPILETGTGSHAAIQGLLSRRLEMPASDIEVAVANSNELPRDPGATGSTTLVRIAKAVDAVIDAWLNRTEMGSVTVEIDAQPSTIPVGSYITQVVQVAVNPLSGEIRVLEVISVLDVAEIVNEHAHQMQIDGGTVMGCGFALLEDLDQRDGQIWAANLGEFKIPSMRDIPQMRTVLLRGGKGVSSANVKNIGEITTPPTAAAIANAVYDATGCRIRELPITPERLLLSLS